MIPFYFMYVTASFTSLLMAADKRNRHILFILAIFLIIFAGLNVGAPDNGAYINIFKSVTTFDEYFLYGDEFKRVYGEYGYLILNGIFRIFTDDFIYLRVFILAVVVGLKFYVFRRVSSFIAVSVLWYISFYYYYDMIALRHGIASSLLLFSVFYLAQKRNVLFFIVVLLAAQFHSAAYVAIVVFAIYKMPFNKKLWLAILIFSLPIGIFGVAHYLVDVLVSIVGTEIYITEKLARYSGSKYDVVQRIVSGTIIVQVLVSSITIIFFDKIRNNNPYAKAFLAAYLTSTLILITLNDFGILANRLSAILAPAGCVLAASFLSLFKREDRGFVFVAIILLATIQFVNISTRLFADYVFVV